MKIVVLDGEPLNPGDLSWAPLEELGDLTVYERTPAELVAERIADADIVFTNKVKLRSEHLNTAANLKFIGEMATGFDNIEVKAAREKGIPVSNVPAYSSAFTAQTAIALLMELTHHVGKHSDAVQAGRWVSSPDFSFWDYPLVDLDGKTMLVIGLGTIGGKVARVGEALGMTVIAASLPGRPTSSDKARVPLDEALPKADVVSLHVPATPETRGLINAERLKLFKPGALLINTARGAVVDEAAVAEALRAGTLGGFAGDVLSVEPPVPENPLLSAPNCIITPHLGWASPEARQRCLSTCVANLKAFLAGAPQNVVN
jgi:glycerate dehydrogenase